MQPDQDPDFLRYGDEAVDQPIDFVLNDVAVADPMKKDKKKKKGKKKAKGKTVILIASGFPGYPDAAAEIEAIKGNKWSPHSEDFQETATGWSVEDAGRVIGTLKGISGPIGRIVFIGHGSPTSLGLSGNRVGSVIRFTEKLSATELDVYQDNISKTIVPKLHENATIDLIACNTAISKTFMKKFATIFKRCVRGFGGYIYWQHPISDAGDEIMNRGWISSDGKTFHKGIKDLKFPVTICPD